MKNLEYSIQYTMYAITFQHFPTNNCHIMLRIDHIYAMTVYSVADFSVV